jgi:hypothetical protein
MATGTVLKLKDVRLAFTQNLFTPGSYKDEPGKPKKYKCKLLIPKDHPQIKEISAEILRLATEEWKEKAQNALASIKGDRQRFCFMDGDLSDYEGFAGNYSIAVSNKVKPLYVGRNPGTKDAPNLITEASGILYSGCFVNANISFWTWTKTGPQMNANLLGLQFLRDGEAFAGGGTTSVDEFEQPEGGEQPAGDALSALGF